MFYIGVVVLGLTPIVVMIMNDDQATLGDILFRVLILVAIIFAASIIFAVVFMGQKLLKFAEFREGVRQKIRLDRFVHANNNIRLLSNTPPSHKDSSLHIFHDKQIHIENGIEIYHGESKNINIANYSTTISNTDVDFYRNGHYSVVSADLGVDKKLPHVFFDAKENNRFRGKQSSLSIAYAGAQEYLLSSEFDKYFKTFIINGTEQDVLYFFTPDIMAKMVDNGAIFDFELKNNHLYMYTPKTIQFSNEGLQYIIQTARYFQHEFTDTTKRYKESEGSKQNQTLSLSRITRTRQVFRSEKYKPLFIVIMIVVLPIIFIALLLFVYSITTGPNINPV